MLIPAIDLQGGRCVRLVEGRPDTATVFGDDPLAWARRWADEGAERLHVVDLDGAFAGGPRHAALIAAMVAGVPVPVEVGGGLRDLGTVTGALATGARWAILGTAAALDPDAAGGGVRALAGADPGRGGRDRRAGGDRGLDADLAADGARAGAPGEGGGRRGGDLHRRAAGRDRARPEPGRDGRPGRGGRAAVIASGGIAGVEDLRHLAAIPGVTGAIVGRALYTGAVDLRAATAALAG